MHSDRVKWKQKKWEKLKRRKDEEEDDDEKEGKENAHGKPRRDTWLKDCPVNEIGKGCAIVKEKNWWLGGIEGVNYRKWQIATWQHLRETDLQFIFSAQLKCKQK